MDVAALAARPGGVSDLGHTGGQWELASGWSATPNVAIDLAGFDPTAGVVELAVREWERADHLRQ